MVAYPNQNFNSYIVNSCLLDSAIMIFILFRQICTCDEHDEGIYVLLDGLLMLYYCVMMSKPIFQFVITYRTIF